MCTPTQCRYLSDASHLVLAVTPSGRIRAVDLRRPRALGRDAAALAGRRLADLVAASDRGHLARTLARAGDGPAVWEEVTLLAADGRPEPMLCCFQRLTDDDGPRGAILMTALRLGRLRSDLGAETAAVLGRLAFACHSPAHRLMQAVEAVTVRHPACEAARRCRDDLDGLLDALSRAAAWPEDLPTSRPVDAVRVIAQALRLLDGDDGFGRLKITLRPECPAAWTSVPPVGLVLVTLHLVANARDATAACKRPRVFIDVSADGDEVAIEFTDNGPGLEREDRACVFAVAAATRPPAGRAGPPDGRAGPPDGRAGLGLAACSELVRFMGGRIHMDSRPRRGTTVVLSLPAAPPPE